jgi:RHS repeat-associated protein
LTDSNGNVVENINYDSFGNGSSSLTRYGCTGREFDTETGLYYYRNRWYDPSVGRFISEDPIGLSGGINLYAYVENDPHSFTDPSGLTPIPVEWQVRASEFQHQGQSKPSPDCECSGSPVEVIIWDRTYPWIELEGVAGHITYNIDGYMHSWEAGGWATPQPAQQYIAANQQYRSGTGYVLDFGSPAANARFAALIQHGYDNYDPGFGLPGYPYNFITNNCGHAFSRALSDMGYNDSQILPSLHGSFIENNLAPYIKEKRYYPRTGYGIPAMNHAGADIGGHIYDIYGIPH